ncbi:MAG: hypothetical protein Q8M53_12425 [Burkholderiales bacterium]|nr:hypothetical protein [Burkholderiales bacterium]
MKDVGEMQRTGIVGQVPHFLLQGLEWCSLTTQYCSQQFFYPRQALRQRRRKLDQQTADWPWKAVLQIHGDDGQD